ncbi:DUF5681 domain-containing protein [Sphingomonas sp. M1-B02]|uniref:DUF5681 domain-containing protein n=1 Tax=Sphingomonas sp. M1-B02 TaxID=3114300 RepID=UPI00223FEB9B|nr:DUF5681 domain-containing protein [Sphingomonas sp. S6-11]UZK65409.1 DUF5681 domain-containing protein [Sphingomonas sp. S6-11]
MSSTTNQSAAVPSTHRPEIVARQRVRRAPGSQPEVPATAAVSLAVSKPASGSFDKQQASPVGYKMPPLHTRFPKGRSGNPKGRPKGSKGLKTLIRELMTAKVTIRTSGGPQRMTRMEVALHKVAEKAFSGDLRSLQTLISLYADSVPDEQPKSGDSERTVPVFDMDAHDLAILEALRATVAAEEREPS